MKWFKELWFIIILLFKTKPSEVTTLTYVKMNYFPWARNKIMCWCGYVVYRSDNYTPSRKDNTHELIHVHQAISKGSWLKYYLSYYWWWVKSGFNYYRIPYEIEAYANEERPWYIRDYSSNVIWEKYVLTRKDWEIHSRDWRRWVKTL